MAYSKADGRESAVSQRPDTPCVSWSPQNARRGSPCSQPVDKEEALDMADLGEPAAITWCKFNRWLPLSWKPSSRTSTPAQGELQMAGHALDQGAFAKL